MARRLSAPPTKHISFALFALETLDFEHVAFIWWSHWNTIAIVRRNGSKTVASVRSFTGFSAAFGVRVPTWTGGALVANYSHSYRAPTSEELYNNGPHPGNLAFEIGDPTLNRELGNGLDFGLRHSSKSFALRGNGFFYHIDDFIFLARADLDGDGVVEVEDDLFEAEYL